jgi:hypothetical protein
MLGQRHYAINNLLFFSRGLLECLTKTCILFYPKKQVGMHLQCDCPSFPTIGRSVNIWKHDYSETLETLYNLWNLKHVSYNLSSHLKTCTELYSILVLSARRNTIQKLFHTVKPPLISSSSLAKLDIQKRYNPKVKYKGGENCSPNLWLWFKHISNSQSYHKT